MPPRLPPGLGAGRPGGESAGEKVPVAAAQARAAAARALSGAKKVQEEVRAHQVGVPPVAPRAQHEQLVISKALHD